MAALGSSRFRESAIVRNSQPEPLDDLGQLTSPHEWAVLACLGLVLAALVSWALLGSVERTLQLDGVLVLSGERHTLRAGAPGAVAEILVQPGERVAAGQAVAGMGLSDADLLMRLASASARMPDARAQALLDERAALGQADAILSPDDGTVTATLAAPGQTIQAGAPVVEVVAGDAGRIDAVAFAAPEDTWPLDSGMAARVTVASPEGDRTFQAELATVAPRVEGPPDWLARMRPDAAARGRGHILRLVFTQPPDLAPSAAPGLAGGLVEGTPCRIEIVLERESPFGLLIRS